MHVAPHADQERAPLSLLQKRLWLFEQLEPGTTVYNTPSAHRLRGRLDEATFGAAFNDLVLRQSSLRTTIEHDGADALQHVHAVVTTTLFPAEDLSAVAESAREAQLLRRLDELTNVPFDLAEVPLFRARVFRLAPDEHVFFFMAHHIIWDGWSFDLFYEEFSELYAAHRDGRVPNLPALVANYADFSRWHSRMLDSRDYSEQFERELGRWQALLRDRGAPPPLPADKPRHGHLAGAGETEWVRVSSEQVSALRELGQRAGGTLFMVLLAAYYALLSRIVGDGNLVVGTPVRVRASADIEHVMGLFTNLLPLPMQVDPRGTFTELVGRVRAAVLDSFASPDVQLEDLMHEPGMRELAGATHFYQAQFSYQDARARVRDWGGLVQEQVPLFQRAVSEDLAVWFLENVDGMVGGVLYNADLFHARTARSLAEGYIRILARLIEDPSCTVADLTRATPEEIERVRAWNSASPSSVDTDLVHTLFEAEVDGAPELVVLTAGSWDTSYLQVERQANRIRACLGARGVRTGSVVALCSASAGNRLVGMLGILKAGATCVLLDAGDEPARIDALVADAGVEVMLGDAGLPSIANWPVARALRFDADAAEIVAAGAERPADVSTRATSNVVAVVVYLTDRGGAPRGIGYTHGGLAALVSGLRAALTVTRADRILATASAGSAMAVLEMLLAACCGARLLAQAVDAPDTAAQVAGRLAAGQASLVFASAPEWRAMFATGWNGSAGLKAVCVDGLPDVELARHLVASCAGLWTALSVPEATIVASCARIDSPETGIHQGRPLPGTTVWALDAEGLVCPLGAVGNLWIGGKGASLPFGRQVGNDGSTQDGDHGSRTRIRGRWQVCGQLETIDLVPTRVVRIDGYAVEPADVEVALRGQSGVRSAVVVPRRDSKGAMGLDAYVAADPRADVLDTALLLSRLGAVLPAHAIPRHVTMVAAMPMLENGEIDVAALPLPGEPGAGDAVPHTNPIEHALNDCERRLATIWSDLLGVKRIGAGDNFFDLGGHSLLAVEMAARVQRETGVRLNLLHVATGTLATLASTLASQPKDPTSHSGIGARVLRALGLR